MNDPTVMNALPDPTFAVRWFFSLHPPVSGDYQLGLGRQECDSCIGTNTWRLSVDDKTLLEDSRRSAGGYRTLVKTIHLEAGKEYQVRRIHAATRRVRCRVGLDAAGGCRAGQAVETARQSDLAIVCLGLNSRLEGEESPIQIPGFEHGDRTTIDLPEPQETLLKAILDTGKPVVVVLLNGSGLAVTSAAESRAILEAWYGGQEGGVAIANTLAGDNNPAGRLPVTFYASTDQLPPFSDYSMKGRTYRFFAGKPLYPFGFGLSYATFEYSNLTAKKHPMATSGFRRTCATPRKCRATKSRSCTPARRKLRLGWRGFAEFISVRERSNV